MKTKLIMTALISLLIISCDNSNDIKIGNGLEIYLTKTPYSSISYLETFKLDTVALANDPILRYKDIEYYDSLNYKMTLKISHDSLKIGDAGVHGRMFIVTIDRKPIYYGFKIPNISSVGVNTVYINEPYESLDNLKNNEIVFSLRYKKSPDPRNDKRIIDLLKKDKKLK